MPANELNVNAFRSIVKAGILLLFRKLFRLRLPELALFDDRPVECAQLVLQLFEIFVPVMASTVDNLEELIGGSFVNLFGHSAALQLLDQNVQLVEIAVAQVY